MAIRADYLCFGILGAIFITSIPTLAERQQHSATAASALISGEEGFRSCPYLDPTGTPTIGYGATFYPDGKKVSLSDACLNQAEANKLRDWHVQNAAKAVDRLVKVPITPNQKTALTSFTFNFGSNALESSALLKKLNAGDAKGAAAEFDRWVHGEDKHGENKVLPGLVKRRQREKQLFQK